MKELVRDGLAVVIVVFGGLGFLAAIIASVAANARRGR